MFSNLSPFTIERRDLTNNGQLFKRVGGCCTGILTPNSTMAETLVPLARGLQFVPWQAPLLVLTNQGMMRIRATRFHNSSQLSPVDFRSSDHDRNVIHSPRECSGRQRSKSAPDSGTGSILKYVMSMMSFHCWCKVYNTIW